MRLKGLLIQANVLEYLQKSIQTQKIAHAYILDGPKGIGKMSCAMAFAKAIYCKNSEDDSCGVCSSCLKVATKNHPDLFIIEPEGKSIKNKQIEDFQQSLMTKPYESHKKIYLIQDADTMTPSAQNRLLKTLEEPPEYGVMILMTSNENILLPTIRSRCQSLKFHGIRQDIMESYLMKKYPIDEKRSKVLATFSDGIIGRAIKIQQSDEFEQKRSKVIELLDEVLMKEDCNVFEWTQIFDSYKENIDEILDMILYWLRDIMILSYTNSYEHLMNIDQVHRLKELVEYVSYDEVAQMIEVVEKTKKDLKANVNFQLAIEMMLLTIQEGKNGKSCGCPV